LKSFSLNAVLLVLVAVCSLPFLALYVLFFFAIGGAWAYAGPNGCHFEMNPIGCVMVVSPVLAVCAGLWTALRKMRRHRLASL
jgi:formate hydrogenlyase subunit 3/multisubunit Na+/H+ antiporter MnhD subunit